MTRDPGSFPQADEQPRNVPITPQDGRPQVWAALSRMVWKHLFLLGITIGISVALIHIEMTTPLFFKLEPARRRGDPCLSFIRPTKGSETGSVWANFGRCSSFSRDPDRETIDIDLRFGLLMYYKTEPFLTDALPWPFTRVLRNQDDGSRPFGNGGSHSYNISLVGETQRLPPWAELVLADGARVPYRATLQPGVFKSDVSGYYADTILKWTGSDWHIRFDNGVELVFPSRRGTRLAQSAIVGIQMADGQAGLVIDRDTMGNILRLQVGGRRLDFEHDADNRVTAISEMDSGRSLRFDYDSAGCLIRQAGTGGVFEYRQAVRDGSCQLTRVKHDDVTYFEADYDDHDRVVQLTDPLGGSYFISYEADSSGKIVSADVREPDGTLRRVSIDETGFWFSHWGSYRGQ